MAKKSSSKKKIASAFHEVFTNEPSTVDKSKSPEGQRKQKIAIALSKARAAGAKVPKKGGNTDLAPDSMKAQMCADREDNLAAKKEFLKRNTGRKNF